MSGNYLDQITEYCERTSSDKHSVMVWMLSCIEREHPEALERAIASLPPDGDRILAAWERRPFPAAVQVS